MKINFESTINNNGENNRVAFAAPLTMSKYNEFDVYEFVEPSKGEMNRIEVSNEQVNIFAGPTTIELNLNKKVNITFQVLNGGQIMFTTELVNLKREENYVGIKYKLWNLDTLVGDYHLELKIEK